MAAAIIHEIKDEKARIDRELFEIEQLIRQAHLRMLRLRSELHSFQCSGIKDKITEIEIGCFAEV